MAPRAAPSRDQVPEGQATSLGRSKAALSWVNFLVAMMQTGFGTFIAVNLTAAEWTRTDVGLALGVSSAATLLAQVPGGVLVDATPHKRLAAGLAIGAIAAAAAIVAFWPARPAVLAAMALQGSASAVLATAIASLALCLVPHEGLADRMGLNVRYGALGTAIAAGAIGLAGAYVSFRLSLLLAAAFGALALVALTRIARADVAGACAVSDHAAVLGPDAAAQWEARTRIARNRELVVFGICMLLFQLGNAGALPLAVGGVVRRQGAEGGLVVAAAVIVSQLLASALATPMARAADKWGRRAVLLVGLVALPVKATLFAFDGPSLLLVAFQAVDSISAASLGLIIPLVVADITRKRGHFNLAMGLVGFAAGIGGTVGPWLAGAIADHTGTQAAFFTLAAIGGSAVVLAWMRLRSLAGRMVSPAA